MTPSPKQKDLGAGPRVLLEKPVCGQALGNQICSYWRKDMRVCAVLFLEYGGNCLPSAQGSTIGYLYRQSLP